MTVTEAEDLVRELAETAKVHRVHEVRADEADAMLLVLAEIERLRDVLDDAHRATDGALIAWGNPTIARGYVAGIEEVIRRGKAPPQGSEEP